MQFTFYGHSCFSIEVGGKKLLFDPFISGNPLAKDVDINKIEADYILVSHGHFDHTGDLISIATRTGATIITMVEIAHWATKQGCKAHGMNFGAYNFEFGEVRLVSAVHSSTLPDGTYGGNPGGFVIKTAEGNFYFAGDTALTLDMQLIPKYYAKLDFAIMPIGGNFTMNVADAVVAAGFVECNKVVAVHFDTFGYIVVDHDKAREAFKAAGKELILPEIGQTISL